MSSIAKRIRQASEADVELLFAIRTSVRENHQSAEELEAIGVTPERVAQMLGTTSRAWIAEVEGEPAAFSMADSDKRTVFAMFLRAGYEGRGLGRILMGCAEEWLFERDRTEIWLTTGSDPRLRAHGFYRALGWRPSGITEDGQLRYVRSKPEKPSEPEPF